MSTRPSVKLENLISFVDENRPLSSERYIQQRLLDRASNSVTEVIDSIEQEHRLPSEVSFFRVVHYTDLYVVYSILKDRGTSNLRMYSSIGFNDPGEGTYLLRQAQELAVEDEELNDFNEIVWGKRVPVIRPRQDNQPPYAYVASFITPRDSTDVGKVSDNLVFWTSYGRAGTGCSMVLTPRPDNIRTVKYGQDEANKTIKKLKEAILPYVQIIYKIDFDWSYYREELSRTIRSAMQKINYLYKSEAYEYENECRLVETPETLNDILPKFDYPGYGGRQVVKRYIDHPDLTTADIDGIFKSGSYITLGPCIPNREDTKEYLERLISTTGAHGLEVRLSEIEYQDSRNR